MRSAAPPLPRSPRRRDLTLIEDDVFGFLPPQRPAPLACFAPERTLYITSLSKSLAPGLRVGLLAAPPAQARAARNAVRLSSWMPPPLMAEIARRWIEDGTAEALNAFQRDEARRAPGDGQGAASGTLSRGEPARLPCLADPAAAVDARAVPDGGAGPGRQGSGRRRPSPSIPRTARRPSASASATKAGARGSGRAFRCWPTCCRPAVERRRCSCNAGSLLPTCGTFTTVTDQRPLAAGRLAALHCAERQRCRHRRRRSSSSR